MAEKKKETLTEKIKDAGFLGELWRQLKLVYYLMRDRDVPIYLKALPLVGLIYVLFPLDIVTDLIPVLGQIDDLMIMTIGAKVFIEMAPADVVAKYTALMRGEALPTIVEGEVSDVTKQIKYIEAQAEDLTE